MRIVVFGRMTLSLTLFLLGGSAPVWAQFDTASVVGTVKDASATIVPGAKVTLTNTETGVSLVRSTTADGNYEFVTVRPGVYLVSAEKEGFSIALMDNVQVQVAARLRVDLQLAVGQLSEKVQVTAEVQLVETDTSQRSQVISTVQIQQLPLNGREYSSLALLTTGVRQSALSRSTAATQREGSFNVNGLRSTANNFMIDGIDNNAYATSVQGYSNQVMQPPPDAVAEFQVVTNNESAEYGHSSGATVNVSYKSGTNQVHGAGWEFNRNTSLNAIGYFTPPGGQKPTMQRNQFGGVLGGPIVRNKMFIFGDYEGFPLDLGRVVFATLPTAEQRRGTLPVAIRDPRTGILYPAGSALPQTAFARTVLGALPDPNLPGTANNYSVLRAYENRSNKAGGKVDLQISQRLSLFGRYGWRNVDTKTEVALPQPSGGGHTTNYTRSKQVALGATYMPSERSVFEVRFGWSMVRGAARPGSVGTTSAFDAYGLVGLTSDPRIAGGLPTQSINGYTILGRGAASPQWQFPTTWNPKVNYTWLRGRQSFKTGYEYQRVSVEVMDINPLYGRSTYSAQFTRPPGAASNNLYNLADFMLGLRSQYDLSNVITANLRKDMHFTYLQDDVRLNDRLTLNLGLRYEYATPFWEADNNASNFDPVTRKMVMAKAGSMSDRALVDPDLNNFGPRLGFAYTPMARTVVRGGYGVGYTHMNRTGSADLLTINPPQAIVSVITQTAPADPSFVPAENGWPAGMTDASKYNPLLTNILYTPRDFQSGRTQSWFVSIGHEFGPSMLLDVAYVGNKSNNMALIANYNQAVPNNAAGTVPLTARQRPFAEYGDITYMFNGGKSRYRGLQVKYEWRMGAIRLLNALTLSQTKDNGSQSLETGNGNSPAPQDFNNLDAEWGSGAYHQPYNNTTSLVWTLPFGRGKRWGGSMPAAIDRVLGGWQIAGINTVTPGEQITFTYTPATAFLVSSITDTWRGANNSRPNVTCDPYAAAAEQSITNWFNKACVSIPTDPSQPFGNAGRNTVRGPGFWSFDLATVKQVPLSGAVRLELRLEAYNLFNRVNFTPPNGNRSTAGFGTITSTYDPRQVQLGVKVLW